MENKAVLETLMLAMFSVMCVSQVMGKPRPVRDTVYSTYEPHRHTTSTEEPQSHTASTEKSQEHNRSTEVPQRHTASTEEPQGQNTSTELPQGYTSSTDEQQRHTASTGEPQGHTTEEPQSHTARTEEPRSEEPQSHSYGTEEPQGYTSSTAEQENGPCGDIQTENISTDKLYPNTETFLMYPFAQQRDPEYFPIPSPPICPIGIDVSFYPADQINKVGTCPYDFVDNVKPKRIPVVIKEARCLCRHGLDLYERIERRDTICREIMQSMKVLIEDGCVDGYYSYQMEEIQVAVGCLQIIG